MKPTVHLPICRKRFGLRRWERLDVLTIVCANRRYNILRLELNRAGINQVEGVARDLTGLDNPSISWVDVARGFGVEACVCANVDELRTAVDKAFAQKGPMLIEAILP